MLDVIGQEINIGDFAATNRQGSQIYVYEVVGLTAAKVRLRKYGSVSTFLKFHNEVAIVPNATSL